MAGPMKSPRTKPLIGVTGSDRGGLSMWWFNRFALWRAGARAVRITPSRLFPIDRLDGLVVGGGDDIEPTLYGLAPMPTVRIDAARDRLELNALDHARGRDLPVLGICRGAQMINVHEGGTLHTDIHAVYGGMPRLRTPLPRKLVEIEPGTRLHRLLEGETCCRVNALHHQAVDRLGRGLRIAAYDHFGIVQAVETKGGGPFLFGVQWHPEFLVFDRRQQALFRRLAAAARAAGNRKIPVAHKAASRTLSAGLKTGLFNRIMSP